MSHIDDLVRKLCPNGVEFKTLAEVTVRGSNIRWSNAGDDEFQYIDLTSVDRTTRKIGETATINRNNAPSRAQQIVREGDVIFATTRPTQMRWAIIPAEFEGQIASTGYCVLRPIQKEVLTNFLAHLLGADRFRRFVEEKQVPGNYPSIPDSRVRDFKIPIPPIEVQQEIVRMLDTFSKLEAELEARRKQYTFYRDQLLTFTERERERERERRIRWARMTEVCKFFRGTAITERQATPGDVPVVANGPVPTYTHTVANRHGETVVIARSGAYAGLVSYWNQPIFLTDAFSVQPDETILKPKFVFYILQSNQDRMHGMKKGAGVPHVRVKEVEEHLIPIPSLKEQDRIVSILDKFNALVNDLSIGLPAELRARRQQYEHYRNRLLTFQEAG